MLRWVRHNCRVPFPNFQDKAGKSRDTTGVRSITTATTAMVLRGSLSGALNALDPVPVVGSRDVLCARGSVIRSTLIP